MFMYFYVLFILIACHRYMYSTEKIFRKANDLLFCTVTSYIVIHFTHNLVTEKASSHTIE